MLSLYTDVQPESLSVHARDDRVWYALMRTEMRAMKVSDEGFPTAYAFLRMGNQLMFNKLALRDIELLIKFHGPWMEL